MPTQTYLHYCLDDVGHLHLAEWFEAEDDEQARANIGQMHEEGRCEIWLGKRLVAKLAPKPVCA